MQYHLNEMFMSSFGTVGLQTRKKESILQLEKHVDKKVHVKFQGGREGIPGC